MSFVERFIILSPYFGGSTSGGSTVYIIFLQEAIHACVVAVLVSYTCRPLIAFQCSLNDRMFHAKKN